MKMFYIEKTSDIEGIFQQLKNEVKLLLKLNHENITKYYKSYKDENLLFIINEYHDVELFEN